MKYKDKIFSTSTQIINYIYENESIYYADIINIFKNYTENMSKRQIRIMVDYSIEKLGIEVNHNESDVVSPEKIGSIVTRKKKDLYFVNTKQCEHFDKKIPLIINNRNRVLFGNIYEDQIYDEAKCIIVGDDDNFEDSLSALEIAIAEENSIERKQMLIKDSENYFMVEERNYTQDSLFEMPKEKRFITTENYKTPMPYNFIKGKKKKEEEIEDENLFSSFGI